jgi:hypothetical protein
MPQVNPGVQIVAILLLITPLIAFWFWMLRDMLGNDRLLPQARTFWLFALLFLNVLGAAMYYSSEYRRRR